MPELFIKDLASIGVVPSGDNPEAEIVIFKSKDSGQSAQVTAGSGRTKETDMEGIDLSALPDDVLKHIGELTEERDRLAAIVAEAETVDLTDDPVAKASDEVQELVAKLRADQEAAEQRLNEEIAKRRDTELVAKIRADGLEDLLGDADEILPTLRELEDAAPEAFGKLYPNLVAAAQAADLGEKIGKELGTGDGEEKTYEQKRDAYVAKRREAGDNRTTAELRGEFVTLNPDAVMASREEK